MQLIRWGPELEIGVPSIDNQHRELVRLLNQLNVSMRTNVREENVPVILDGLLEYTNTHFAYEEQVFLESEYPEADIHIREHELLRRDVLKMKQQVDDGCKRISVELMFFMREWLNSHILESDKAVGQYLSSKGVI